MNSSIAVMILLLSVIVFTGICLAFYMYKLILIDANSRNMNKPKFWAFLASTAQNGSGIPLYLFKRTGTLSFLTVEEKKKVTSIKRKIIALLILDLVVFLLAVIVL
ncbi:hypothetical protein ACYSNW_07485 [Enterococcus sp. LJL99]